MSHKLLHSHMHTLFDYLYRCIYGDAFIDFFRHSESPVLIFFCLFIMTKEDKKEKCNKVLFVESFVSIVTRIYDKKNYACCR